MDRLAERIGEALRAEAQAAKRDGNNISGWRAQEAEALGVHVDTFTEWYFGNSVPGGASLLRLFDRYPALEVAIRGETAAADRAAATVLDQIRKLVIKNS